MIPEHPPTFKDSDNIDEYGLPLIEANDMIEEANGELPFNNDKNLIHEIDYAFGRVLQGCFGFMSRH